MTADERRTELEPDSEPESDRESEPDSELESDSEPAGVRPAVPPPRPAHLSPASIGLVAAGGVVGTALRYGLSLLLPAVHRVPVAIGVANIVGAFALAVLLETLSELGPDHGPSRNLRLGAGTGLLGGFTTYSALTTDTVTLALQHPALAAAYGVGTVVLGALASIAGIALARARLRPRLHDRMADC